jgi:hypothetical protein
MSYKNVFFNGVDNVGFDQIAATDTGHGRLDKCRTAIFTGATAPSRLAEFLRTYVNVAVLVQNGVATEPGDYTTTDIGLPISCVLCIYFTDGMWYLIYQDHNPYSAVNMPFNKVPNPADY